MFISLMEIPWGMKPGVGDRYSAGSPVIYILSACEKSPIGGLMFCLRGRTCCFIVVKYFACSNIEDDA